MLAGQVGKQTRVCGKSLGFGYSLLQIAVGGAFLSIS